MKFQGGHSEVPFSPPGLHSSSGFPDSPVPQIVEQALEEVWLDGQDFLMLRR